MVWGYVCVLCAESLKWLKMADNNIRDIPTEALRGMHKLQEFDFKKNNITILKDDAFEMFGKTVKFVYLQSNQ